MGPILRSPDCPVDVSQLGLDLRDEADLLGDGRVEIHLGCWRADGDDQGVGERNANSHVLVMEGDKCFPWPGERMPHKVISLRRCSVELEWLNRALMHE